MLFMWTSKVQISPPQLTIKLSKIKFVLATLSHKIMVEYEKVLNNGKHCN